MDALWIGTVSTLAGILIGALLEAWREQVAHRRALRTRWDQQLLLGLVDYLATADRAVRSLLRLRHEMREQKYDINEAKVEAISTFESMHERSQVITLLTGNRRDPVRVASRRMREALLPLRDALASNSDLPDVEVQHLVSQHRDARSEFIQAAQVRLGVPVQRLASAQE